MAKNLAVRHGPRFTGPDGMTAKQARFVVEYVQCGGQGSLAAERAGYSSPAQSAYGLLRLPAVRAAVDERVLLMVEEGKACAMATLLDVARNGRNESARVAAASKLAQIGRLIPEKDEQNQGDSKPISQWTVEQLMDLASRGRQAMAIQSSPVIDVTASECSEILND